MTQFGTELAAKLQAADGASVDLATYGNAIGEMFAQVESLVRENVGGEQRLPNGDFETNITGWSANNAATVSRDTTKHKTGVASLKCVTGGVTYYEGVTMWPPVAVGIQTGLTYTYYVWAWVPTGQNLVMWFDWRDINNTAISSSPSANVYGNSQWQLATMTSVAPAGAVAVNGGHYDYVTSAFTFWIDSVVFVKASTTVNPVWSHIMDPELANTESLRWLSQLAGVQLPPGIDEPTARRLIELASGRRRGTLAYMIEVTQALLSGAKAVFYIERYNGSAYQLRISTRTSETANEAAVLAALLAIKPAGIVLTYNATAGITWDQPTNTWNGSGLTWDASVNAIP